MGHLKNELIEITNWLNSDRKYDDGVFLYQKYGKNPALKRLFPGREKFQSEKLAYELGKLIGLGFSQKIASPAPVNNQDSAPAETLREDPDTVTIEKAEKFAGKAQAAAETLGALAAGEPVSAGNYPPVINRIIAEFSRLYNERAMLKKQENDTPDENTPDNIEKRRVIIEKIESISKRMDILYTAKKAYLENNIAPNEKELYPASNQQTTAETTGSGKLIMKRNNLRSSITRANNMLEYQSQKKAEKSNPMPECPKRKELEQRIKEKEKELAEIEMKLKDAINL